MLQRLKGLHLGFLRQMAGMKARKLGVNTWRKEGENRLLEAAGTKPLRECIGRRQATVAKSVTLRPILEGCAKKTDTRVKGGVSRAVVASDSLGTTVEDHDKKYFGSSVGEVTEVICQVW